MKDTYSINELAERYKCWPSTIYRNMKKKGYPRGGTGIGSRNKISGTAVYDWELVHMPWLHNNPEETSRIEEDEQWKGLTARHEAWKAQPPKKEREPVPKKGWKDVRREIARKGVIKPRHSKAAVARVGR